MNEKAAFEKTLFEKMKQMKFLLNLYCYIQLKI